MEWSKENVSNLRKQVTRYNKLINQEDKKTTYKEIKELIEEINSGKEKKEKAEYFIKLFSDYITELEKHFK